MRTFFLAHIHLTTSPAAANNGSSFRSQCCSSLHSCDYYSAHGCCCGLLPVLCCLRLTTPAGAANIASRRNLDISPVTSTSDVFLSTEWITVLSSLLIQHQPNASREAVCLRARALHSDAGCIGHLQPPKTRCHTPCLCFSPPNCLTGCQASWSSILGRKTDKTLHERLLGPA